MLPDSFFAADGLLESTLHVVRDMAVFPGRVEEELASELPFLSTTRVLLAAVAAGMGREQAHRVIRSHAGRAAAARRAGDDHDLWASLGDDPDFPLDEWRIREAATASGLAGRAGSQVDGVVRAVAGAVDAHPHAATYRPETLL